VDGTPVRVLKVFGHPRGYVQVTLSKDNVQRKCLVHRLVLQAFAGMPENLYAVGNHLNGDKQFNAIRNLEWCSQGANLEHYRKMMEQKAFRREVRLHQDDLIPF
jgi:predicted oxidoreductase (fatty acid repression mutant protein)